MCGLLSVSLNLAAAALIAVAQLRVAKLDDTSDAALVLGGIGGLMMLTTVGWWLFDGLKLLRGKVRTSGEQLKVQADEEEEAGSALSLTPPAHWRMYKTPAGHEYYYDPHTERVHYLASTGFNNYCIDPMLNVAINYDTLEELDAKLSGKQDEEAVRAPESQPSPSRSP